ncbi:MAG: hypothetical protein L3J65_01620 [Robiginitomaculum sp.]|nr:hypothetical protein [Robiginitomaculum sp.]
MGERKKRRQRFFATHPKCCFCGGTKDAVEVDHQPSRDFFVERSSPRDLRFPACSSCNRASAGLESIFNYYSCFDPSGKYSQNSEKFLKRIDDFNKRFPTVKPFLIGNRAKKDALRDYKIEKPTGLLWQDIPMIGCNENVRTIIDLCLVKIGVAIFYKAMNFPAPVGAKIVVITEHDISMKAPSQLELFELRWEDFLAVRNPRKKAQSQLGIKFSNNKRDKAFFVHLRINLSFLCTIGILYGEDESSLDVDYEITKDGFPWGVDIKSLLKGKQGDVYYEQNP